MERYRRRIPTDLLDAARQALARHDWQAASDDTVAAGDVAGIERAERLDIESREAAFAIFTAYAFAHGLS